MSDLLFEIGTEEIPAGFLQPALGQLRDNFIKRAAALHLNHGEIQLMGTPRRFALLVNDLADCQPDRREEFMGPSKQAAFDDDGNPTKAAQGFARSKGGTVDDLEVVSTDKGEYLMLVRQVTGEKTTGLLPDLLQALLADFSFAKSMRWGDNTSTFARPIQWLLAINDGQVVPFIVDGIATSNTSRGHRFMADHTIVIDSCADYEEKLAAASVIADPQKRRIAVVAEITAAVESVSLPGGAKVSVDENLVDTVTNLVESPFGVCGTFEERFLDLPEEVLVTSMREHQKYFPVVSETGGLLPAFVAVNNTKVKNNEITRAGHERVLRARLDDAMFFFASDKTTLLSDRVEALKGIIFQAKLGTMQEKTSRIIKLSGLLAEKLEPESIDMARQAAGLCKTDLLTDMVGEFPSLQGVMGQAYAVLDGLAPVVSLAIKEHYMPLRAGSALPTSATGAIIGLADRIDTIVGCFGIGQLPTGTTDPFGLRRLSLAVLHIIIDRQYTLSLQDVVAKALALYGDKVDGGVETADQIVLFIKGRFVNDLTGKGVDQDVLQAATESGFDDVNDCLARIKALTTIRSETAFPVLASSFKRIRNIIKKHSETDVDSALLVEDAEKELARTFAQVQHKVAPLLAERKYQDGLAAMLVLKEPVDSFFDSVMVMAEDEAIRNNRLNLLTAIASLFLKVGDISRMHNS